MLVLTPAGFLAVDDNMQAVDFRRFSGSPNEAAEKIRALTERGEAVQELYEVIQALLERNLRSIVVDNESLASLVRRISTEIEVSVVDIKVDLEKILEDNGILTRREYRSLVREIGNALSRSRIKEAVERRDIHIVHAVRALDDVERHLNQIYTRVREWYGVHFPELEEILDDPVDYLRFVAEVTIRDKINEDKLNKVLQGGRKLEEIIEAGRKSLGAPLSPQDANAVKNLAGLGLRIADMKERMAEYIRNLMSTEAPNLSAVAGPVLGSRLISLAGGLEKLARMPASTIQVLGAEKALFRFLRTGRGAPKHGVIFQHPYVHTAPRWQRGKIARALATKISIAAKIDYFTKEDRSSELKQALDKRVDEIKKKYPRPPPKVKAPPSKHLDRRRRRRRR